MIAAVPALAVPRPPVAWPRLIAIGATLFAGQFLLQFFAIADSLPPGLASLLVQTQALFTIVFAAIVLRERPTARQLAGVTTAFAGLVLIVLTVGQDMTLLGFALAMGSAISWGIGNILLKGIGDVEMLHLVVWLSLVPPLPALALALVTDGPAGLAYDLSNASSTAVVAALYLGIVGTILAYAIWGRLLRLYPAATVTPFALLVPFVGGYSSALVFGERFGPLRLAGMALVLMGIAIIVLPWDRRVRRGAGSGSAKGSAALSVRPAGSADAPGVVELIGRVYVEYGFVYVPEVEVPDLFQFDRHYAPPHGAFYVVREGDVIVGSVGVERLDDGSAELHRLYLDTRLRGRGTGRALVEAALDWCRAQKIPRMILWSDTRFDQAHRLYDRMGFRRTGERVLPGDLNQTREYGFERPV